MFYSTLNIKCDQVCETCFFMDIAVRFHGEEEKRKKLGVHSDQKFRDMFQLINKIIFNASGNNLNREELGSNNKTINDEQLMKRFVESSRPDYPSIPSSLNVTVEDANVSVSTSQSTERALKLSTLSTSILNCSLSGSPSQEVSQSNMSPHLISEAWHSDSPVHSVASFDANVTGTATYSLPHISEPASIACEPVDSPERCIQPVPHASIFNRSANSVGNKNTTVMSVAKMIETVQSNNGNQYIADINNDMYTKSKYKKLPQPAVGGSRPSNLTELAIGSLEIGKHSLLPSASGSDILISPISQDLTKKERNSKTSTEPVTESVKYDSFIRPNVLSNKNDKETSDNAADVLEPPSVALKNKQTLQYEAGVRQSDSSHKCIAENFQVKGFVPFNTSSFYENINSTTSTLQSSNVTLKVNRTEGPKIDTVQSSDYPLPDHSMCLSIPLNPSMTHSLSNIIQSSSSGSNISSSTSDTHFQKKIYRKIKETSNSVVHISGTNDKIYSSDNELSDREMEVDDESQIGSAMEDELLNEPDVPSVHVSLDIHKLVERKIKAANSDRDKKAVCDNFPPQFKAPCKPTKVNVFNVIRNKTSEKSGKVKKRRENSNNKIDKNVKCSTKANNDKSNKKSTSQGMFKSSSKCKSNKSYADKEYTIKKHHVTGNKNVTEHNMPTFERICLRSHSRNLSKKTPETPKKSELKGHDKSAKPVNDTSTVGQTNTIHTQHSDKYESVKMATYQELFGVDECSKLKTATTVNDTSPDDLLVIPASEETSEGFIYATKAISKEIFSELDAQPKVNQDNTNKKSSDRCEHVTKERMANSKIKNNLELYVNLEHIDVNRKYAKSSKEITTIKRRRLQSESVKNKDSKAKSRRKSLNEKRERNISMQTAIKMFAQKKMSFEKSNLDESLSADGASADDYDSISVESLEKIVKANFTNKSNQQNDTRDQLEYLPDLFLTAAKQKENLDRKKIKCHVSEKINSITDKPGNNVTNHGNEIIKNSREIIVENSLAISKSFVDSSTCNKFIQHDTISDTLRNAITASKSVRSLAGTVPKRIGSIKKCENIRPVNMRNSTTEKKYSNKTSTIDSAESNLKNNTSHMKGLKLSELDITIDADARRKSCTETQKLFSNCDNTAIESHLNDVAKINIESIKIIPAKLPKTVCEFLQSDVIDSDAGIDSSVNAEMNDRFNEQRVCGMLHFDITNTSKQNIENAHPLRPAVLELPNCYDDSYQRSQTVIIHEANLNRMLTNNGMTPVNLSQTTATSKRSAITKTVRRTPSKMWNSLIKNYYRLLRHKNIVIRATLFRSLETYSIQLLVNLSSNLYLNGLKINPDIPVIKFLHENLTGNEANGEFSLNAQWTLRFSPNTINIWAGIAIDDVHSSNSKRSTVKRPKSPTDNILVSNKKVSTVDPKSFLLFSLLDDGDTFDCTIIEDSFRKTDNIVDISDDSDLFHEISQPDSVTLEEHQSSFINLIDIPLPPERASHENITSRTIIQGNVMNTSDDTDMSNSVNINNRIPNISPITENNTSSVSNNSSMAPDLNINKITEEILCMSSANKALLLSHWKSCQDKINNAYKPPNTNRESDISTRSSNLETHVLDLSCNNRRSISPNASTVLVDSQIIRLQQVNDEKHGTLLLQNINNPNTITLKTESDFFIKTETINCNAEKLGDAVDSNPASKSSDRVYGEPTVADGVPKNNCVLKTPKLEIKDELENIFECSHEIAHAVEAENINIESLTEDIFMKIRQKNQRHSNKSNANQILVCDRSQDTITSDNESPSLIRLRSNSRAQEEYYSSKSDNVNLKDEQTMEEVSEEHRYFDLTDTDVVNIRDMSPGKESDQRNQNTDSIHFTAVPPHQNSDKEIQETSFEGSNENSIEIVSQQNFDMPTANVQTKSPMKVTKNTCNTFATDFGDKINDTFNNYESSIASCIEIPSTTLRTEMPMEINSNQLKRPNESISPIHATCAKRKMILLTDESPKKSQSEDKNNVDLEKNLSADSPSTSLSFETGQINISDTISKNDEQNSQLSDSFPLKVPMVDKEQKQETITSSVERYPGFKIKKIIRNIDPKQNEVPKRIVNGDTSLLRLVRKNGVNEDQVSSMRNKAVTAVTAIGNDIWTSAPSVEKLSIENEQSDNLPLNNNAPKTDMRNNNSNTCTTSTMPSISLTKAATNYFGNTLHELNSSIAPKNNDTTVLDTLAKNINQNTNSQVKMAFQSEDRLKSSFSYYPNLPAGLSITMSDNKSVCPQISDVPTATVPIESASRATPDITFLSSDSYKYVTTQISPPMINNFPNSTIRSTDKPETNSMPPAALTEKPEKKHLSFCSGAPHLLPLAAEQTENQTARPHPEYQHVASDLIRQENIPSLESEKNQEFLAYNIIPEQAEEIEPNRLLPNRHDFYNIELESPLPTINNQQICPMQHFQSPNLTYPFKVAPPSYRPPSNYLRPRYAHPQIFNNYFNLQPYRGRPRNINRRGLTR